MIVVQKVGEEASNSAFLLFSASAIACFNDPSRKDFNRGITEEQKRRGAADKQNSMGLI
jgi:hypothetical protein